VTLGRDAIAALTKAFFNSYFRRGNSCVRLRAVWGFSA